MKRLNGSELAYQAVIYFLITLLLIVSAFPLLYVVSVSLTSEAEWLERGNLMLIPLHPTLEAYKRIFVRNGFIFQSFGVSLLRTLAGTAIGMFITMMMGFATSRRDMPGGKALMFMTLITVLFSGGLIPTFLVVKDTKLYDTFWAMVIPCAFNGWNILVARQFFSNLPREVEEAAEMDGASRFQLLTRILLPMSGAVIAALGLFSAVGHWNSWFDAMIYIKNENLKPLQLILYNMNMDANMGYNINELNDFEARVSSRSLRMAITVIGVVPILCVYPFLQKYFTKGVYVGAVKG